MESKHRSHCSQIIASIHCDSEVFGLLGYLLDERFEGRCFSADISDVVKVTFYDFSFHLLNKKVLLYILVLKKNGLGSRLIGEL